MATGISEDQVLISDSFHVFANNGRIHSNLKLVTLLSMPPLISWDVCCFSETGAKFAHQIFIDERLLMCSHCAEVHEPASGVAILISSEHASSTKTILCVNDRVMAIDLMPGNRASRSLCVYLPHAGYPWGYFRSSFDILLKL